jgi:hypothetical protein
LNGAFDRFEAGIGRTCDVEHTDFGAERAAALLSVGVQEHCIHQCLRGGRVEALLLVFRRRGEPFAVGDRVDTVGLVV